MNNKTRVRDTQQVKNKTYWNGWKYLSCKYMGLLHMIKQPVSLDQTESVPFHRCLIIPCRYCSRASPGPLVQQSDCVGRKALHVFSSSLSVLRDPWMSQFFSLERGLIFSGHTGEQSPAQLSDRGVLRLTYRQANQITDLESAHTIFC